MHKFTLSIPAPCHERWDQMASADKGRFCASCQKTVMDFTNMTDQQLAALFKKPAGNICGRFAKDQLERDIAVPTKRIPWLRYFFQFTLPAFLLSLKAMGQKAERVEKVAVVNSIADAIIKTTNDTLLNKTINGKVRGGDGDPIPYATVVIKGTKQGVVCDSVGSFVLPFQNELPFTLIVSCIGFEPIEYEVKDTATKDVVLTQMREVFTTGLIIVSHTRKPKKAIPLISDIKKDTAFNKFSVYPNPARSNGTITIDCKKLSKGIYAMQILAIDGRPVCTKQLELEQKGGLLRADLPTLTHGQYVITLTSTDSKKVYTEKIQVL